MIIVLIHWCIKPTDTAVSQFLEWWKDEATISNKTGLVGEFLSAPLPANQFRFRVDDLAPRPENEAYRPFVNVGIWRDRESFYQEVGQYFRDDKPPMEFEAKRRRRTILEPKEWRIGAWYLPETGTCD
jgi:hypothetical protein